MQLGPGRSPCRREATVTTLPKTDLSDLEGHKRRRRLHHYDAQCAAQSIQPNYVRALHLRGHTLTLRGMRGSLIRQVRLVPRGICMFMDVHAPASNTPSTAVR